MSLFLVLVCSAAGLLQSEVRENVPPPGQKFDLDLRDVPLPPLEQILELDENFPLQLGPVGSSAASAGPGKAHFHEMKGVDIDMSGSPVQAKSADDEAGGAEQETTHPLGSGSSKQAEQETTHPLASGYFGTLDWDLLARVGVVPHDHGVGERLMQTLSRCTGYKDIRVPVYMSNMGSKVHCVELALVREGASLAMDSLKFKDIRGFDAAELLRLEKKKFHLEAEPGHRPFGQQASGMLHANDSAWAAMHSFANFTPPWNQPQSFQNSGVAGDLFNSWQTLRHRIAPALDKVQNEVANKWQEVVEAADAELKLQQAEGFGFRVKKGVQEIKKARGGKPRVRVEAGSPLDGKEEENPLDATLVVEEVSAPLESNRAFFYLGIVMANLNKPIPDAHTLDVIKDAFQYLAELGRLSGAVDMGLLQRYNTDMVEVNMALAMDSPDGVVTLEGTYEKYCEQFPQGPIRRSTALNCVRETSAIHAFNMLAFAVLDPIYQVVIPALSPVCGTEVIAEEVWSEATSSGMCEAAATVDFKREVMYKHAAECAIHENVFCPANALARRCCCAEAGVDRGGKHPTRALTKIAHPSQGLSSQSCGAHRLEQFSSFSGHARRQGLQPLFAYS